MGDTVVEDDKSYEINQLMAEDQGLSTTERENLKFAFEVDTVLLADGTRLGQPR